MKKTNAQKGITLIALIITIAILLILAVVTINSIKNGGIIDYAKKAQQDYAKTQKEEQDMLDYYQALLAGKIYKQNGTTITLEDQTFQVGDYVNYNEGLDEYTGTWQILGIENNQILLVTSDPVGDPLVLQGADDYTNGITKINEACQPYLNTKYATSARNINLSDINRMTGYDPEVAKFKHNVEGEVGRYGNEVSYKINGGYVEFTGLEGTWIPADGREDADGKTETSFTRVDGAALKEGETVTEKSNYYAYYLTTLTNSVSDTENENFKNSSAYAMLAKDTYWIANQYTYTRFGRVVYGIYYCIGENINGQSYRNITGGSLYITNGDTATTSHSSQKIRPVVALKPDVALTRSSESEPWTIVVPDVSNGYSSTNPTIPGGFTALDTETAKWGEANAYKNGLVITDDNNNEFVWIPVENINEMVMCQVCGSSGYINTSLLECTKCGEDTKLAGKLYINEEDQASLRYIWDVAHEPYWGEDSAGILFKDMVRSVNKYKGFYVGRYETAMIDGIAQSKSGVTPTRDVDGIKSDTYSTSNSELGIVSSTIYGCQYDAMLRFILSGPDSEHIKNTGYVSHVASDFNDGCKPYKTGGTDYADVYNGTIEYNDIAANIYDLEGNLEEETQEERHYGEGFTRGGSYFTSTFPSRKTMYTGGLNYVGSRMSLYITEEK